VNATARAVQRTLPQIDSAARAALVLVQEAIRNPQVAEDSLEKVARTLEAMANLTGELAGKAEPRLAKPSPGR
jgi:hypothetical protein